jgi:hypothetical protein
LHLTYKRRSEALSPLHNIYLSLRLVFAPGKLVMCRGAIGKVDVDESVGLFSVLVDDDNVCVVLCNGLLDNGLDLKALGR